MTVTPATARRPSRFAAALTAAALVAGTALVAPALLAPATALAQGKPKPPAPPKFSKPVQLVLAEVQKLQAAAGHADAIAKLDAIEAMATTPDDKYFVNLLRAQSAQATNNKPLLEKSLAGALDSGQATPEQTQQFTRLLASLAAERKDYNAAIPLFEKMVAMNPADSETLYGLATLNSAVGNKAKMQEWLGKAFAANAAKGVASPENWYRLRLGMAVDAKNNAEVPVAGQALIAAYPTPVNWRDVILTTRDSFTGVDDQGELDFLRLQAATGSLNGERDFVAYAETALQRGFPGEAQFAINAGIQKGALQATKPLIVELKKTADSKVGPDKAGLPTTEKEAKGNAKLLLATGDAYYGYGDYAKAAALYRQAVGGVGADANTANLRLGAALARAGDAAGAEAALNLVNAGPRAALAKLWLTWLKQPKA